MDFDRMIGQVQHRTELGSKEDALKATRATLSLLGARLAGGAPQNVASQLPEEVGRYLTEGDGEPQTFSVDEFFELLSAEVGADVPQAADQARAVINVVREAVGDDTLNKARSQLPPEWDSLFYQVA